MICREGASPGREEGIVVEQEKELERLVRNGRKKRMKWGIMAFLIFSTGLSSVTRQDKTYH